MKLQKRLLHVLFAIVAPIIISLLTMCKPISAEDSTLRGIWLSYVDFEYAELNDKSEEEFTQNAEKVFRNLKNYGFNTIFFHVRAFDDAIYPSEYFSWCKYIASEPLDYDPLKILVELSHEYDIEFHAWINPYRITMEKIYNPAKQSTINHIVDGVKEIIENYPVDGIHFDDYFYPSKYKGNAYYSVTKKERKENVNKMIRTVYQTIKTYNPEIKFGISPAGNIKNCNSIGCDIKTWLNNEGYVDYIIPQIYWSDNYISGGKKTTLFTDCLEEWTSIGTGDVPIYTGLALYKAGSVSSIDRGWRSYNNMVKQIKQSVDYGTDGYVMFSYKYLFIDNGKKETANYIKYLSKFKLTKNKVTLKRGKRYNISKKISIKKAYKCKFKYSSSNSKIASVNKKGIIKAKKKGTAKIYITGPAGSKINCTVKVS